MSTRHCPAATCALRNCCFNCCAWIVTTTMSVALRVDKQLGQLEANTDGPPLVVAAQLHLSPYSWSLSSGLTWRCTVISLGEHSFLDLKSMVEENWTAGHWAQRQNLSVVMYHTLFSHNEEQFHQTGFKRDPPPLKKKKLEKRRRRRRRRRQNGENLNSKTLFYKNCSLGSVTNLSNY